MMSATYTHPVAEDIFSNLAKMCEGTASMLRIIGGSAPALLPEEKDAIDSFFGIPEYETSTIGEEFNQALAQQISEYLEGLGRLLESPLVTPSVIAPLAFTAIKSSSLLKFINQSQGIDRTMWSIRAVTEKTDSQRELFVVPNLNEKLSAATRAYRNNTSAPLEAFPDDKTLVQNMLMWSPRPDVYEYLEGFANQLAWPAVKNTLYQARSPQTLEISSIEIIFDTLRAAEVAARHLAQFRDAPPVNRALQLLDTIREQRNVLGKQWTDWMTQHELVPLP